MIKKVRTKIVGTFRTKCDRVWRTFATGVCFAVFFSGGLLESITIFPILYAWPGSQRQKRQRVRHVLQQTFRFFVWLMDMFGVIEVRLHNAEKLRQAKGCMVIANHPTLIDVVILMSIVPRANGVVKGDLWHNPYLKRVLTAAGFISNADGQTMLAGCADSLAAGDAIVIFPEGSRSVPGQPLAFRRGVANIAVRTDAPLLTVFIRCQPTTLIKGEAWYQIPPRKAVIDVFVHEWLQPQALAPNYDDKPAAARQLTYNLQKYFEKGLETYG